ncbi:S-4TM family putative pore-forming effector [Amycolatopsis mediterranei]|uniref:S-4TM family putative pore-forming effector n=1 Tax=Amycolatopsis mediterranei TaxID=33910 RepID=UPI0008FFBF48|nr:S-4TM family putative pore-forming effector [Amycolatopsis mediterranei]UZF73510.1 S-4TM family putative pore-forming effector [Amycolatopsis mediterranei]
MTDADNSSDEGEYSPPTSKIIASKQNTIEAARLLLAQRRLYSRSKRWLALKTTGVLLIAITTPIASLLWPKTAVIWAGIATLWLFAGRTILTQLEKNTSAKAAAVQEIFDVLIFDMPSQGKRTPCPTLEEISSIAGDDDLVLSSAKEANLLDWYPIDTSQDGSATIAICQRANASYSDRLLRTYANFWLGTVVFWAAVLIGFGIWQRLSLATFLLGIFVPLLPAFLNAIEYWFGIRRAAADRSDLTTVIEDKLANNAQDLEPQDLLVWQSRLYTLRRDVPQVPDFIYKLKRKKNEAAMKSVASLLSARVTRSGESSDSNS